MTFTHQSDPAALDAAPSGGIEVRSPLTEAGKARYRGVLAADAKVQLRTLPGDFIVVSWPPSAKSDTYHVVANLDGRRTPIGKFVIPKGPFAGSVPVPVNSPGPFTVAGDVAAMNIAGRIALFTEAGPRNALTYDTATTQFLGAADATISVERSRMGAGA